MMVDTTNKKFCRGCAYYSNQSSLGETSGSCLIYCYHYQPQGKKKHYIDNLNKHYDCKYFELPEYNFFGFQKRKFKYLPELDIVLPELDKIKEVK